MSEDIYRTCPFEERYIFIGFEEVITAFLHGLELDEPSFVFQIRLPNGFHTASKSVARRTVSKYAEITRVTNSSQKK